MTEEVVNKIKDHFIKEAEDYIKRTGKTIFPTKLGVLTSDGRIIDIDPGGIKELFLEKDENKLKEILAATMKGISEVLKVEIEAFIFSSLADSVMQPADDPKEGGKIEVTVRDTVVENKHPLARKAMIISIDFKKVYDLRAYYFKDGIFTGDCEVMRGLVEPDKYCSRYSGIVNMIKDVDDLEIEKII